ncbi:efflux RND transporter permease subunit [Amphibiibacter pelophylacis]|uniref:Efflux RND transporter permease subunit n=1 Tax=Amphibiibacter pelophylacis TaxID=1799477 RepID=A0ACC6P283_9BURK
MSTFFIRRPIFAWVIALFIILLGALALTRLPVNQYPSVAPPQVQISFSYPGASATVLESSVISVIETQLNGTPGMAYMSSSAQANGSGSISVSFEPGTDADLAQVEVQNRLSRASSRLPSVVTQQGVDVRRSNSNFLMFVALTSTSLPINELGDYANLSVVPELQRIDGIGQAQVFGAQSAMRIWLDPEKLRSFNLSAAQVLAAVRSQNVQVAAGSIGDLPNLATQAISASVTVSGQMSTPEQFGAIVLRPATTGGAVYLRDVARIERGLESYSTQARANGTPAVGIGIQLSPSGNAVAASNAIHAKLTELSKFFPAGVSYSIPYDASGFVKISIRQVAETLVEAVVLVFLVMLLFLQNIRYTIIPTIVVPIALLGSAGALLALGMSINVLTLFGMVLVVGIVVDDAIVVVENVERLMREEQLSPWAAARKGMAQISGAIIGVTVVLMSVFMPLVFFSGSVGNIYRQFAAVMLSSILFSAFLALTLTPALCATLLKPVDLEHHENKRGLFGWFNRAFDALATRYGNGMARMLTRGGRMLIVYLLIAAVAGWLYTRLPSSFLPSEDQGSLIVNVQLPPGATQQRTLEVMKQVEGFMLKQPEVKSMVGVLGFSFSGQGQNAALAFVSLKDWKERTGPGQDAQGLAGRAFGALGQIKDAIIYPVNPPPIPELGNASGFSFQLQDRSGQGHAALLAARNQLLGLAAQSKVLAQVRPDGLEDAPQLQIDIDRAKAQAQGVDFSAIAAELGTQMGSSYANDFPSQGRLLRVMVQADSPARMQPDDLLKLTVLSSTGQAVPLSSFATVRWGTGPVQTTRYNGYSSMGLSGSPAPGYSSGQAIAEMQRLAGQLPQGFGYEWTGQSREELLAGSQAVWLYAFAVVAVLLCLAALYESWSIPLAVILAVPLGLIGVIIATVLRGYSADIYFQIGLVTIIGLSAKNAILIVEFAKEQQEAGHSLFDSALQAAKLRFRPILMTSMAFTLGVVPLFVASGAGAASQRSIGTGVLGGMITGTVLAVLFVPVLFIVVRKLFGDSRYQQNLRDEEHSLEVR